MACYEIASLRLALFNILGDRPSHERSHEELELGTKLQEDGPLKLLAEASSFYELRSSLDAASLELEQKVADMDASTPQLGYWRSLVVTVKRTQSDLARISADIQSYYNDLDEIHDVLHEIFPESD